MNCNAWMFVLALAVPAGAQIDERYGCEGDLQMTGPTTIDGAHLGAAGDTGGDWDGDGLDDILTGGGFQDSTGTTEVFLFLGQDCPASPCSTTPLELSAALVFGDLATEPGSGQLWTSCAFVGDIDGGGQDDIALAEPYWDGPSLSQSGRVFVFFAENHQAHTPGTKLDPETYADVIIEGTVDYGWFGFALDGLDVTPSESENDLLVGAPGNVSLSSPTITGHAYALEGTSIVAAASSSPVAVTALTGMTYTGGADHAFGYSVARVGNVTGDSREEFVVGAPQIEILSTGGWVDPTVSCTDCKGYAAVYGYASTSFLYRLAALAPTNGALKGFGYSVAGVPSVNSGSVPDVIVGAPWYKPHDTSAGAILIGAIYVYDGPTGNLIYGPISPQDPAAPGQPDEAYKGSDLGFDVEGVDDFDGDGKGDIMAGAPLFVERSTACGTLPLDLDMTGRVLIYSGADGSTILARYKGELGGGKPRLGLTVASGDVNGDGDPDTYAGQLGWSAEPGADEEGRAFIFFNGPCCP